MDCLNEGTQPHSEILYSYTLYIKGIQALFYNGFYTHTEEGSLFAFLTSAWKMTSELSDVYYNNTSFCSGNFEVNGGNSKWPPFNKTLNSNSAI